jgi:hypothetical protein
MKTTPSPGRPSDDEFALFYAGYVSLAPEDDIIGVLERQAHDVEAAMAAYSPAREQLRYAAGKWSVRELLGHVIDAERVFGFRAFCFSRGDRNPLPGFEQNDYIARSDYDRQSLGDLVSEFRAVREVNLSVLRRLDAHAWRRIGTASGERVSVRALAYIMAGHVRHHLGILRTHYR